MHQVKLYSSRSLYEFACRSCKQIDFIRKEVVTIVALDGLKVILCLDHSYNTILRVDSFIIEFSSTP